MGSNCYFYFRFIYIKVNGYISGRGGVRWRGRGGGWGTVEGKGGGSIYYFKF